MAARDSWLILRGSPLCREHLSTTVKRGRRRNSVLRLGRGGGAAAGLAAERARLFDGRLEIALAVAERHAALADRLAGVGFAFDAAIDGDQLVGRAFDLN